MKQTKTHRRHKMNEREGRFNQTVSDPQLVCKIVTLLSAPTTAYASINEAARRVYTRVKWWGQDSKHSWRYTTSVPSMSSSCPWLPSRVRDRKGAKSTKVSLSRGATFSKALSSFVVMLSKKTRQDRSHKRKLDTCIRVKM